MIDGHREAERQLAAGMSPGARIALGLGVGFCGVIAALNAEHAKSPAGVYAVATFCGLIAVACATHGWVRRLAGRLIGGAIFLVAVAYLISQVTSGPIASDADSEPSVINAVAFLVAFGLPGGYYAVFGRFRDGPGAGEDEVAETQ